MLLEIVDLVHAVYFQTPPMYTMANASQPSPVETAPGPRSRGDAHDELNQTVLADISNFLVGIPNSAETGEQTARRRIAANRVVTPGTFEDGVKLWQRPLQEAARATAADGDRSLARICGLAERLHLLSTCSCRPHPLRLQAVHAELFDAMKDLPERAWESVAPELHTRV